MRRPVFPWFSPVPVSLRCSCGAIITLTSDPAANLRPTVVPSGCARCWPKWIERRLARAVVEGAQQALAVATAALSP
jgi:hypothetical protein